MSICCQSRVDTRGRFMNDQRGWDFCEPGCRFFCDSSSPSCSSYTWQFLDAVCAWFDLFDYPIWSPCMHSGFCGSVLLCGLDLFLMTTRSPGANVFMLRPSFFNFRWWSRRSSMSNFEDFLLLSPEWECAVDMFDCLLSLRFVVSRYDGFVFKINWE